MEQRETFDAVADLYGEVRPGYPTALYEDLARLAGLNRAATVLEVGCGAGQATKDLAARARWVTALDPGAQLIAEARRRIPKPNLTFAVAAFELYDPAPGVFDLVASAQAWHWVDPEIGFRKAATALRPGGALAIFGHVPLPPDGAIGAAFEKIYDTYLPGAWGTPSAQATYYRPSGPLPGLIGGANLFGPATHRAYEWIWRLDPKTFGRYLRTDSSYHVLPEAQRFALFDALSQAVAENGGVLDSQWETHLYVAAKT
jgi:SAM-dependent methyltransferase